MHSKCAQKQGKILPTLWHQGQWAPAAQARLLQRWPRVSTHTTWPCLGMIVMLQARLSARTWKKGSGPYPGSNPRRLYLPPSACHLDR